MSEGINNIYDNVMITMPYTIYLSTILASLASGNYNFMYFFLYVILAGDGFNFIIKETFKNSQILPKDVGMRPSGGGGKKIGKLCRGCGIYPSYKDKIGSKTYGFPSGHAHITSLTMTFWTMYIINTNPILKTENYISIILLWIIFLLVCIQRIRSRCHNVYQIIGGAFFGVSLGILGYHICHLISPTTYPIIKQDMNQLS